MYMWVARGDYGIACYDGLAIDLRPAQLVTESDPPKRRYPGEDCNSRIVGHSETVLKRISFRHH